MVVPAIAVMCVLLNEPVSVSDGPLFVAETGVRVVGKLPDRLLTIARRHSSSLTGTEIYRHDANYLARRIEYEMAKAGYRVTVDVALTTERGHPNSVVVLMCISVGDPGTAAISRFHGSLDYGYSLSK